MPITRIVAYAESSSFDATKDFYVGLLGLREAMDTGDFLGLASHENPTAQVIISREGFERPLPRFGVDVGDPDAVDALHAEAERRGLEVVYPLADEPWGVRRFFVRDPSGTVVNVLAHMESPSR